MVGWPLRTGPNAHQMNASILFRVTFTPKAHPNDMDMRLKDSVTFCDAIILICTLRFLDYDVSVVKHCVDVIPIAMGRWRAAFVFVG